MHCTRHENCQSMEFSFLPYFLHFFKENFKCPLNLRGYFNITQLQITFTDLMFDIAKIVVYKVCFISISFFGVLVLKFWVVL